MKSWILQLIMLSLGFCWFIWSVYGQQLLHKMTWINKTNHAVLQSIGNIKVNQDFLQVKFTWTVKNFSFRQIEQIKAYSQADWGLTEHEQIDILFDTGDKISFNGSLEAHREIILVIASGIGIQNKDWPWGCLPCSGDIMGRDIIYQKMAKAN